MKRLVVLTGANISAESGPSTFRDNNRQWTKSVLVLLVKKHENAIRYCIIILCRLCFSNNKI